MAKFNVKAVQQVAKQKSNTSAPNPPFNAQQVRDRGEDGKKQAYKHNAELAALDRDLGPQRGGRGD